MTDPAAASHLHNPSILRRLFPTLLFAGLTFLMFWDVLFSTQVVVGHKNTDLMLQFLPWREFGFGQLRKGNLALWNPYIFGGAPYFAGFQSALLYPPNWLHLILPLTVAINWIVALHVFLAGSLMHAWCRYRGLSSGAGMLAGVMYMFSGPYFLHIYAGHLPHLCLMPWAPLLFCSIDGAIDSRSMKWPLVGIFAMLMILLAGHPQYVYYTGIVASIYVLFNLLGILKPPEVVHFIAAQLGLRDADESRDQQVTIDARLAGGALLRCALIVVGGAALAAVQLFSGFDAASESVRSGGTSYEFAASFSLPPENLMTFLAPGILGQVRLSDQSQEPQVYFGCCYLWETCVFVSITGLVLAVYGIIAGDVRARRYSVAMVLISLALALGRYTLLHRYLVDYLPKFGEFRGAAKFSYLTVIFLSMLAGCGYDALRRQRRAPRALLFGVGALLVALLFLGFAVRGSADAGKAGAWGNLVRSIIERGVETQEIFFDPQRLADPQFIKDSGLVASRALLLAALSTAGLLIVLALIRRQPAVICGLIFLATVELFIFARPTRSTMPAKVPFETAWRDAVNAAPKHQRVVVVDPRYQNYGMSLGFDCVWGYDPGVLKRYAEVLTKSQGQNPNTATQYLNISRADKNIFAMIRAGLVLNLDPKNPVIAIPNPMPVAALVSNCIVKPDRDAIFSLLQSTVFDPRYSVLLESEPSIRPTSSPDPGTVRLVEQTSDTLELEANVSSPCILVITNSYSAGWHATPLEPGPQSQYQVMPANWALQAIPLAAGKHHLKLEYLPAAFRIGAWVSAVSLLLYLLAVLLPLVRRRFARTDTTG
jgi:hypothetical protein